MRESVANRGFNKQADIFLDGWTYTQSVEDVTTPGEKPTSIHFETGFWLSIPESNKPALVVSLARMASIPHGTTINAQCFQPPVTTKGAPDIAKSPFDITPFITGSNPEEKVPPFTSQKATNNDTFRIPQDLTQFIKANTLTQEMIDNPNVVLVNANKGKEIIDNTVFTISTTPTASNEGGGTSNIGFLVGDDSPSKRGNGDGNANAAKVTATYWVSTVNANIDLKPFKPTEAQPSRTFSPAPLRPNEVVPVFSVKFEIPSAKTVKVQYTQIQYSQNVFLDFGGLSWPHASVATLIPTDPQELHPSILRQ
ncbi:hypothetical protein CSPAE12_02804 [Colletotrichum incanum]|nr:hypothetical protein CSPAE12_02804 [Colletotrichum incanum]